MFSLKCFFLMLLSGICSASGASFMDETLITRYGQVTLRRFGTVSESSELVICIPGMNPDLAYEWSTVAEPLAEQGYLTVIVNLNGNQKRMRPTEMLDLIGRHIVREHFKMESYILMGKSWGGGMALEVVRANRASIKKVVLIAPAGAPKLLPAFLSDTAMNEVPLFLGWAEDDPIISSWSIPAWQTYETSRGNFVTKQIPSGGHVVSAAYVDAVLDFLKK